jgi:hypothetical protein
MMNQIRPSAKPPARTALRLADDLVNGLFGPPSQNSRIFGAYLVLAPQRDNLGKSAAAVELSPSARQGEPTIGMSCRLAPC